LPTGELVVAVADGAGSAPSAKEGAQMIVEGALAAIATQWACYRPASRKAWRDLVYYAFHTAQQGVLHHAAQADQPPRAYAATLLLAIISHDLVACGLVGDCAIVVATESGELQSLCKAQRGPYANSTYFATHHDLQQYLDVQLWEGSARQVALLTDGLLNLALNLEQNQPYAPFFAPLFAFATEVGHTIEDEVVAVQQLTTFLNSDRINQRTHDDKTLVLVGKVDR
jgi:Protein phosphatase 2C